MTSEAYQELGPLVRTALARPPERRLPSLERLTPATSDQFRDELTACLALVVPVGMTEESRREWLAVAWQTLKHLPADILKAGCRKARLSCDHPSKIVPAIIAETSDAMRLRRDAPSVEMLPAPRRHVMDRRGEPMDEADTAELNRILEYQGATVRYRPDGSRYPVGEAA